MTGSFNKCNVYNEAIIRWKVRTFCKVCNSKQCQRDIKKKKIYIYFLESLLSKICFLRSGVIVLSRLVLLWVCIYLPWMQAHKWQVCPHTWSKSNQEDIELVPWGRCQIVLLQTSCCSPMLQSRPFKKHNQNVCIVIMHQHEHMLNDI